jgi:hypothetical protein
MWMVVGACLVCIIGSLVVVIGTVLVKRWRRWWYWAGWATACAFTCVLAATFGLTSAPVGRGWWTFAWITAVGIATVSGFVLLYLRVWLRRHPTVESRRESLDRFWHDEFRDAFRLRPEQVASPREGRQGEAELRARIRELEAKVAKQESSKGSATGAAGGNEQLPGG